KTTNYTYNSLNQLVSSVEVGETSGAVSIKSEETDNGGGSEQQADDEGESDTTLSNKTYTYDKNGNQLREADSITNEVKSYAYDADNRMSKAMFTKAGIVTVNQVNTYNGNGQRVEKSENGQSTKYYYQNDSVLYTTGNDDKSTELEEPDNTEIMTGVTSLNLMGASENAIATVRDILSSEGEKYYFYNKDMRESTTNVVGVEGKSEVAYEYTDFGETEIKGDENFFNEICYTGGIYDKKIGLYYLNARYYNPEDGRFLTEDTYRGDSSDPSSLHLYAYCVNNPIAYKDPSGHIPVLGIINAGISAYDGYNYAKKRNIKGVARAGVIVGHVVVGTINPFKKVKLIKGTKVLRKVVKKKKTAKVILKRVNKFKVKSQKQAISAVRKSKKAYKNIGGSFKRVDKLKSSSEVGHHIPQNAYMKKIGVSRNKGPAVLMKKSEHLSTRTYGGRGKKAMIEDKNLNARQRLAKDIKDVRRIVGRKYNKALLKSIKYSKTLDQFKKR
ncbi:RHS repeat domain-containing protein, partial [Clostridium sp.]|uniref:RHS repeat domain-containing protein n=1 Tax=Clostridium sp. TaxID=1506 RepID=UPI002FC7F78B